MRLQCAHYAHTVCLNCFGSESMGPQCAHNAPTMRSLVFKLFWVWVGGRAVRSLSVHCVATVCWTGFGFESMGLQCDHCAPPGHPLCVGTILGLNRWARIVCAMRPLCAHDALTMRPLTFKPFWVQIDGPTMRPLCARDALTNHFGWCKSMDPNVPMMRPLCAHYVFSWMCPHAFTSVWV